jgi:hemoglobin
VRRTCGRQGKNGVARAKSVRGALPRLRFAVQPIPLAENTMKAFVRYTLLAGLLVSQISLVGPAVAQEATLYKRLGGYDAISAVVTEFADSLFNDPKLEKFFGGLSADSRRRFRQHNIEFVCNATGGPCDYLGRPMTDSHQGSKISDADFNLVAGHLVTTLDKFKVPKKEKDELVTMIGGLRPLIVEGK